VTSLRLAALAACLLPCPAGASTNAPASGIRWHASTDRHDASIPGWSVTRVLGRLAVETGWRVLVEPGVQAEVQARFQGLPAREALPRILGGLNFTFTTATNGVATLRVFKSRATAAGQEVRAEGGRIGDELIVQMKKPGAGEAERLAGLAGGTLSGTNGAAFRLKFDSDAAAAAAKAILESSSEVASVENNLELVPPETPVAMDSSGPMPPLGLNPTVNPDGSRRVIALVDTAVQPLSAEFQAFLLPSVDIVSGAQPSTGPTHGTSMAEAMIQGLGAASPDRQSTTRIRPYDVYGSNAYSTTWDVARAVTQAVQDGATIVNLSLGSGEDSPYLRDVVRSVSDQGALVIAAAGNDASSAAFYPAAYDSALAVTASGNSGQLARYANFGDFVDIAVPGAARVSVNGGAWVVQGTSVSSAFASGVAGGMARDPFVSLGAVRQSLTTRFPFQTPRGP